MNITCGDHGQPITNGLEVCRTYWMLVLAVVFLICFIASAIIALFYKQKLFREYIYRRYPWLVPDDELDFYKIFDAFISYAQLDSNVLKEIKQFLENNGFKLCLHERDWMAGDLITEQIDKSVKNSRRTIILASTNFLNSAWCLKEFRAAYEQNQKEGHRRLIVILLEDDISTDNEFMNEKFRDYLKLNTYLKWSDSEFSDKLKRVMPHPQNNGKYYYQ